MVPSNSENHSQMICVLKANVLCSWEFVSIKHNKNFGLPIIYTQKNVQLLQPTCEAQVNTSCFQAPQVTIWSTKIVTGHAVIQLLGWDPKAGLPHQPLKPIHLTNLIIVIRNTKTHLWDIPLPFNFILLPSKSKVLSSIPSIFPHLLIIS